MPHLFDPITLRQLSLRNRVVISPMCMYSAEDGIASDFHLTHLGRFAIGGAGLVIAEATAVSMAGRITPFDLGIWSDAHIVPLAKITALLKKCGAAAGIQLAHAGRKAATKRPWDGGLPLDTQDSAHGYAPWPIVAPSALPHDEGFVVPQALTHADIDDIKQQFHDAAIRALKAGFDVIEIHAAHGYLLHSFLSPIANQRHDEYGGSLEGRMRLPLAIAEDLRTLWPQDKPVFVRISAVDGIESGYEIEDMVIFAKALKAIGIDVIDCSSGGMAGRQHSNVSRGYGFQVNYAEKIKREAKIATQAVGLIIDPQHADAIISHDQADLVAIGRVALKDPNWPLHAEAALKQHDPEDPYASWPHYGWWLAQHDKTLARLDKEAVAA